MTEMRKLFDQKKRLAAQYEAECASIDEQIERMWEKFRSDPDLFRAEVGTWPTYLIKGAREQIEKRSLILDDTEWEQQWSSIEDALWDEYDARDRAVTR